MNQTSFDLEMIGARIIWESIIMNNKTKRITAFAEKHQIQLIYAFGSRAKEIARLLENSLSPAERSRSDLDIGIKAKSPLNMDAKVDIAVFFEDLFDVPKVDVVALDEAPVFLALEIVEGEILYACDEDFEAEYQLFIMRRAAELVTFDKQVREAILGG